MDLFLLQSISHAVSEAHDTQTVLRMIVNGLADQAGLALARIWLTGPVPNSAEVPAPRVVTLAASAGASLSGRPWTRLDGEFRSIPLGHRKIGRIAATGESILLNNLINRSEWVAHPDWVRAERIRVFAGHPLVSRGEILGVLGIFGRQRLSEEQFLWLRLFADQAATAIANARAFEEIDRLREQLQQENEYLRDEVSSEFSGMIGTSAALAQISRQIAVVAPTNATVLITGESGSGKELAARMIHARSTRAARPLVKVNCASIPRDLFESEFFGHVKGAFTGAIRDRLGRFQLADGGTLFLDEVGEIPLELQGKLLRVLQEGEFERLGDETTRKVDVRLLAATNRNLKTEVAAGRFREDLYFRLSVFPLEIPPLRERPEDIAVLTATFVERAARELRRAAPAVTAEHLKKLQSYSWPGNVRELQNVLERAVILSDGNTLPLDIAPDGGVVPRTPPVAGGVPPLSYADARSRLLALERESIERALEETRGKIYGPDGAAELLGMRPTTLVSKIDALKIVRRRRRANR